MDSIITTPVEILKTSNISLIGYEFVAQLDNPTKTAQYIASLKSAEDMIPHYASTSMNKISAISKTEAMRTKSNFQSYDFHRADKYIDSIVLQGMKIIRLTWDNNGTQATTLCAVSDSQGIVYDNFISNALVVTESITTNIATTKQPVKHGEETWILTANATWIIGGNRGNATISQSVFFYVGDIMFHNFSATHNFTWGTSNAQVSEVERTSSIATIAYGYGFSTANNDVRLVLRGSVYELSFNSSFGSNSGAVGRNSIISAIL